MECFAKNAKTCARVSFLLKKETLAQVWTIFSKIPIIDVWQGLKYAAVLEWKHTIMITTFFNIRKQTLTVDLEME